MPFTHRQGLDRERITLDKYEYKVRADEIKDLIAHGDYVQAAEIADTIDWRRVKSVMMLCTISDLYKINRRYEDAKNMLLLAYERRPGGRTICYSLCELCIKTEEFVQAVNYYKEFVQVAPKDPGRYILQYKLYEAQDVSLEERISVLEELKKRDYREKWAYELAYLYHRVGLATRCVEECDELILWFGEGKYVIKAMELKMLHEPLTAEQQKKYDHRFDGNGQASQQEYEAVPAAETVPAETQIYEAPLTKNVWGEGAAPEETVPVQETSQAQGYHVVLPEQESQATGEPEEVDIQVKTMDVGQYNTINLQAELAEGLKEVLGDRHTRDAEITRSIMEPMMNSDTESLDLPEIDEVDENDLGPEAEEMESSEVFFGETEDLSAVQQAEDEETGSITQPEKLDADMQMLHSDTWTEEAGGTEESAASVEEAVSAGDETAELVMSQMREESTGKPEEQVMTAQPPEPLARVLSQESDGQIRLVMPESESIEKQITGQMSIEDILNEWERMKKENEEKRREEVRQHVLQQTGTMFTEFEASVRDGLLEQLEKGAVAEEPVEAEEVEAIEEPVVAEEAEVIEEPAEAEETEAVEEPEELEAEEEAETADGEEASDIEEVEEIEEIEEVEEPEELEAEEEAEAADGEEASDIEEVEEIEEIEEVEEPEELEAEEEAEAADGEEAETADGEEVEEIEEPEETEETEEVEEPEEVEEMEDSEAEAVEEPVEREKAKVRSLTREERELYAPFIQSRSAREGLVKAIDNISMAAYTGNIVITGDEGMDTITLAKNMIREVQMTDSNFSGKVAKISGEGLNSKNPAETLERLKSGALIVQKASEISRETAEALHRALQQESLGIIIVLEDTKKAMNKFLAANSDLAECFTARVDVEALSNDTLVAFGRQYAREMEYSIDELGVLALHTRIEELQTIDHAVTVVEVKEIVDEAIHHANRKTPRHFFDILFARRYDEEDMIILTEKDFA